MFRIDKACDVSAFTDSNSSRYALGGIHFLPPNADSVRKRYLELRKPAWSKRTRSVNIMPACEAYRIAMSENRGTIEATDGRIAIRIPTLNGEEFPQTRGAGREPKELLIPVDAFKTALRDIPRKPFKPVLASARLTASESGNDAIFSTWTGEQSTDRQCRVMDGRYPRVDDAWPTGAVTTEMHLGAELLEKIAKHARTHGTSAITFKIRESESAIEFSYSIDDEREARGLLMPCTRG